MEVDVTQEMIDLHKMYRSMLETLSERKESSLRQLVGYMERFTDLYHQEEEMKGKLLLLRAKAKGVLQDLDEEDEDDS